MDLQLKNRTALVTGATKGIGRAIALAFAAEGANVAVCSRTQVDVDDMVETLHKSEVGAFGLAVNVRDDASVKNFIDATAKTFGGIDIVVSNVSAASRDWREMLETDLMGAQRLFESSLPYLRKSAIPSY